MSVSEFDYPGNARDHRNYESLRDDPRHQQEDELENSLLPYVGVEEIKDIGNFLKSLSAEFVGTSLLVFIGCGSCIGGDPAEEPDQLDDQANIVRIALCFGITVATLAQTMGHVSGCNINPAVSLGLIVGGKLGLMKGCAYILCQCGGAVLGSVMLYAVVPSQARGAAGLGKTNLAANVTLIQGLTIEMLITMVLVMIVFAAAADSINAATVKGSAPLAIGLSITTCHLFAVPLTGSSMNPARSLGPAVILQNFSNHWVYWVGPLLGSILAAIFYQVVLRARGQSKKQRKVKRVDSKKEFCKKRNESPAYEKKQPEDVYARDVIACRESNGKELVWIENIDK